MASALQTEPADPANPMGTDGFEFVEYTAPDPEALAQSFKSLGFSLIARHRSKDVSLYRQGDINFVVNAEPNSRARQFAQTHGPSICAMAFRVTDATFAMHRAASLGVPAVTSPVGPAELDIPAIEGIGGSLIYLVDRYGSSTIYDVDFRSEPGIDPYPVGAGLQTIDHLTHNVRRGRMDHFTDFYHQLFNFREVQYFDITGEYTGLTSRALAAPCGKIRIPINEPKAAEDSEKLDQIGEFINQYKGEGIQHVALSTNDIFATHDRLKQNGVRFMTPPPDTYYEMLEERLPGHGESVAAMQQRGLLLDGADGKYLLQIFTETCVGPIFFEIIQRKGDEGFGNGNFRALFLSMERDQIRRGIFKVE